VSQVPQLRRRADDAARLTARRTQYRVHAHNQSLHGCAEATGPGCNTTFNGFSGLGPGPRFGKGLAPKPLFHKQGPPPQPFSVASTWPSVAVKPGRLPTGSKGTKIEDQAPGPGAYHLHRSFDLNQRKAYATMGLPHSPKRENTPPAAPPVPTTKSVRVRAPPWKPHRRERTLEATPGPGQYQPCDSSFCACTNCEGIAQGKSFGLRPEVYTGHVRKAVLPGPADYHVECTTLGAAAAPCDDAAAR
jgi:hypothetical protein